MKELVCEVNEVLSEVTGHQQLLLITHKLDLVYTFKAALLYLYSHLQVLTNLVLGTSSLVNKALNG